MRTALFDGHCQSQRPRRACGAGPSLAGWEGKFGTTRVLAVPCRSVAAKQASPTRSERSDAACRAWVGRGAGGKPKKNRPIQNPSLPSLVGTAPVRPGRAARRFAPARPSAPARSSSPAHRRTALAPSSAPAPPSSPAHCRMDAANRSAQGAPAALAHPLRDGKEHSEHRGFWLAPIAASPQSRRPPPPARGERSDAAPPPSAPGSGARRQPQSGTAT